jgi:hypothetical protein
MDATSVTLEAVIREGGLHLSANVLDGRRGVR